VLENSLEVGKAEDPEEEPKFMVIVLTSFNNDNNKSTNAIADERLSP
jgi:hypothetical protein